MSYCNITNCYSTYICGFSIATNYYRKVTALCTKTKCYSMVTQIRNNTNTYTFIFIC